MTTMFSGAVRRGMLWVLVGTWLFGCGAEEVAERDLEVVARGISDCTVSDSTCDAGCGRLTDYGGNTDLCSCRGSCTQPGCGIYGWTIELRAPTCPSGQGLVIEPGIDECSSCVGSDS